jgi:hypothetical protein
MRYEETKTATPRETHPPVSARSRRILVVLGIAAVIYVILGIRYASGQTLTIAGMSGPAYWAGYAAQVLAWPAMSLMH